MLVHIRNGENGRILSTYKTQELDVFLWTGSTILTDTIQLSKWFPVEIYGTFKYPAFDATKNHLRS